MRGGSKVERNYLELAGEDRAIIHRAAEDRVEKDRCGGRQVSVTLKLYTIYNSLPCLYLSYSAHRFTRLINLCSAWWLL